MAKNWRQIEGRNPVLEALHAGSRVFKIFLEEGIGKDEKIREILRLAHKERVIILKKGRKNLGRISRTANHQGVIAQAAPLKAFSLRQILQECEEAKKDPLIVVLPQVLYEYNLGAIIRNCEAVAVDCLVISRNTPVESPVVARASMGAVEYVAIVKENLFSALSFLKRAGLKIITAEAGAKQSCFKTELSGPLALIIGSEDKGISTTLAKKIDLKVKIPMRGQINSLNMSVAAGIILYEILRQKSVKSGS